METLKFPFSEIKGFEMTKFITRFPKILLIERNIKKTKIKTERGIHVWADT